MSALIQNKTVVLGTFPIQMNQYHRKTKHKSSGLTGGTEGCQKGSMALEHRTSSKTQRIGLILLRNSLGDAEIRIHLIDPHCPLCDPLVHQASETLSNTFHNWHYEIPLLYAVVIYFYSYFHNFHLYTSSCVSDFSLKVIENSFSSWET